MNTTIRNTALASILFAAASGVFAAESADLTVKGVIKPAACTPTLAGGGIIDFGTIVASSLSSTAVTTIPTKIINVTLTCDAATKMGIVIADNRAGTQVGGAKFGLGAVGGKNIGSYNIAMGNTLMAPTADGQYVAALLSTDGAKTWYNPGNIDLTPTNDTISWAPAGSVTPTAYKTVIHPLYVAPRISKTGDLPPLTQEIPFDGSATISVKYL